MRSVFQSDPEVVFSYNGFQNNDKHFINYLRVHGWHGDYVTIDKCTNTLIPNTKTYDKSIDYISKDFDVIGCVAPCAGLSSFSSASNANSPVNDWMYKSTNFILENVKPKILWGENSIFLSSNKGRIVADNLAKIGNENDYFFLIYSTENVLHGNPQKRPRTFYFYFRKSFFNKCPIIDDIPIKKLRIEELLDNVKIVQKNDPMNVIVNKHLVKDDPFYQYWYDYLKVKSHRELIEKLGPLDNKVNSPSLLGHIVNLHKNNLEVAWMWFEEHGFEKESNKIKHIDKKLKAGGGVWLRAAQVDRGFIPAFVGDHVENLIHPRECRFITFREALSIMGMPYDFNLVGDPYKSKNHICQNVCMSTSEVFSKEIEKLLMKKNKECFNISNECEMYYLIDHRKNDLKETRIISGNHVNIL